MWQLWKDVARHNQGKANKATEHTKNKKKAGKAVRRFFVQQLHQEKDKGAGTLKQVAV